MDDQQKYKKGVLYVQNYCLVLSFLLSQPSSDLKVLNVEREGGYKKTEKSKRLSHAQLSLHNLMRRFMVYVKTQEGFFLYLSKLGCAPKINLKEINLHLTSQPSLNYRDKVWKHRRNLCNSDFSIAVAVIIAIPPPSILIIKTRKIDFQSFIYLF